MISIQNARGVRSGFPRSNALAASISTVSYAFPYTIPVDPTLNCSHSVHHEFFYDAFPDQPGEISSAGYSADRPVNTRDKHYQTDAIVAGFTD
jgi:hypothetical protein